MTRWRNYYLCPCGNEWEDEWDASCNDKCGTCNKEIEPYISDDGSLSDEDITRAHDNAYARMFSELSLPEPLMD